MPRDSHIGATAGSFRDGGCGLSWNDLAVDPVPGGTAAGGRDLVFVSYSHQDAEWALRLRVLLKPLVRRKRLRLWIDTDIRVGDEWHPDIIRAIEQSSVALLLVSADFLYSDFIMEQEVPALIKQGVRLAPVLVGECYWDHVPELRRVEWLHDPVRGGALNLVADQGQRDRRLREICDQLIAVAPHGREDVVTGLQVVGSAWPVAAVQAGTGWGELSGVPALPPGYLPREELAAVIDAVVAIDGGAVGLTGQVRAVGLHGQGGIGKSVLAAALAQDEGIRRRFPDGVYWVTVGEKADLLAVQLELLTRLGVHDRTPRTPAEAVDYLLAVLENQHVLLVVDDVWSDAAASAFRATGPQGRVLYTSRDPQVLAAAGARLHQVDVLSSAVARELAAAVLDVAPSALPAAADRAFADVGRVALAVVLLAAAVRGGRSWDGVATTLQRDTGVFGDHPYANTFKAMQIAITALPCELSEALLSLAAFPADIQIPIAAITRYWAHTRTRSAEDTARDLDALAAANVLRVDGDAVAFHDLQHDYLLLHAPRLALLHAGLLDAYRALLPTDGRDQWWRLPVEEPYLWDHLVAHLRGAGERRELAATVTAPAYLAQRIAMDGPHAAEADLSRATLTLPTHHLIAWWRGWIGRHAHLLTHDDRIDSNSGHGDTVAPTMRAWLAADQSLPEGVDPDRLAPLLPDPHLTLRWGLAPPATALVRVLTGHTGGVFAVAWSPDGIHLASAGDGGEVRVWDAITGAQLTTQTSHTGSVITVAWSPDGTHLAAAGDGGEVKVWDAITGAQLTTQTSHTGSVITAAWSPDGTHLATAGDDRKVRVWDTATGAQQATLTSHSGVVGAAAWSPDGARLATAGDDREVRVWDAITGAQQATLTSHTGGVLAVAWSPDGARLATAGYDGEVRVWDAITGVQRTILTGHTDWVNAVAWSPDGARLATAGDDRKVRVWDAIIDVQLTTQPSHTGSVVAVAWSFDGARLASVGTYGEVRVWDAITGAQLTTLTSHHTGGMFAVAWSADGARLATAGYDGEVRVWDAITGAQLTTLTSHHTGSVFAVAWSPDGTRLASAGTYGEVRVWDAITGAQLTTQTNQHTHGVRAVAWSPDGTRLVTAGDDGKVRMWIWDAITGAQLTTQTSHTRWVRSVVWSPDGARLASTDNDREVRVWDAITGAQLTTLTGHTGSVVAVAWSPDGARLASTDDDGKIYVFDLDSPSCLTCLRVEPLTCLQWTSAGIAVGGSRGVGVFDLADTAYRR
jgi:WD40 repeat protein